MKEKLAKYFNYPDQKITREAYNDWKNHPVTHQFFKEFADAYMNYTVDASSPDAINISEGVKETITQVFGWSPVIEDDDESKEEQ